MKNIENSDIPISTPLTSADVVYTYELPQRHEGLYYSDLWDYITSVEATDEKISDLTTLDDYADFVKSPQHEEWRKWYESRKKE